MIPSALLAPNTPQGFRACGFRPLSHTAKLARAAISSAKWLRSMPGAPEQRFRAECAKLTLLGWWCLRVLSNTKKPARAVIFEGQVDSKHARAVLSSAQCLPTTARQSCELEVSRVCSNFRKLVEFSRFYRLRPARVFLSFIRFPGFASVVGWPELARLHEFLGFS